MRFLIDRCAGRILATWLVSRGHDTVHIADLGPDPGDEAILRLAASQQRILITIDTDFGALVFRDVVPHCGIVRLPDVPPDQRLAIMTQLLARHASDMQRGAIITVRGSRIRITLPPRRP